MILVQGRRQPKFMIFFSHIGSISVEWTEKNAHRLLSLIWKNMILIEQTRAENLRREQHVM